MDTFVEERLATMTFSGFLQGLATYPVVDSMMAHRLNGQEDGGIEGAG